MQPRRRHRRPLADRDTGIKRTHPGAIPIKSPPPGKNTFETDCGVITPGSGHAHTPIPRLRTGVSEWRVSDDGNRPFQNPSTCLLCTCHDSGLSRQESWKRKHWRLSPPPVTDDVSAPDSHQGKRPQIINTFPHVVSLGPVQGGGAFLGGLNSSSFLRTTFVAARHSKLYFTAFPLFLRARGSPSRS
ncbi:unnamed protein product [Boreogadus saida]